MPEHAAQGAFALVAAAAAVVVRFEIDTLAVADRLACGAVHSALAINAGRGGPGGSFASRLTVAAVIHVAPWIDASHRAVDERQLAAKLAFACLARGRRMGGARAHLAAGSAIRSVARGVHARRTTGRLGTIQGTGAVFTDLARATNFPASAAVFGIGALVDASPRALLVAAVAVHGALPVRASRNSVGGRRTNFAARAAVVEVRVELLAAAIASPITGRAGDGTGRVLTNGSGVGGSAAGLGALSTVTGVSG